MSIFNSYSDFNKYRVFYAVAEVKSFSKATELLHVSQPAISHAIKELEDQLNAQLFIRDGKHVMLTEDGEKLLTYVKKAFDNLVTGERAVKESSSYLTGKIRIGMYSHIAKVILPKLIKKFVSINPHVRFTIFSSTDQEMKEKLRNKELDLLILHYPIFVNEPKYTEEKIDTLESCFFGNKYYYDLYMNGDHVEEKKFPLILPMKGFIDTNLLEFSLKNNNIDLKPTYRIYSTEIKVELAKEGLGVCWGSKCCIEKELLNKELYIIPFQISSPDMDISICYDEKYLNKTVKEFIKFMKEEYKKN